MSEASDWMENAFLSHLFSSAWSPATTLYIALCSAAPIDADGGGDITDASYSGYLRVPMVRNQDWSNPTSGTADNATAIVFPAATGGTVDAAWFAIVDGTSAAGGASANMYCYGALTATLSISNGITPQFPTGDLDITVA
jgi:hypothetical protein